MLRAGGVLTILGLAAMPVWAGEVHTRSTAASWASDARTGVLRASIPNDTGFSFWVLSETVSLASPVTVIAQIRYANHVDYGGVGVALMDPTATSGTAQKHVRVELSDRQDHVAVGGWLGNENAYGSGGVKATGRDIKVGEWYELALKIDGIRVTSYLDGAEMWSGDVPELRQLPGTLAVAPFVIEADAEIKVTVRASAPAPTPSPPPPPVAGKVNVKIEAYGYDETDGSDVGWNRGYPSPSLDDDPQRRGKPNAEWTGSYSVRGDQLCVRVDNLTAPYTPNHVLAIGYMVALDGAAFADGQRAKRIIVHKFSGQPTQTSAEKCERLGSGGGASGGAAPTRPEAPPYTGLPTSSKNQKQIEALFRDRRSQARTGAEVARLYDNVTELILVVGKFHFLLDPATEQWHFWDRVHRTWEPTGWRAGDATFTVVRGKIKLNVRRGARRA